MIFAYDFNAFFPPSLIFISSPVFFPFFIFIFRFLPLLFPLIHFQKNHKETAFISVTLNVSRTQFLCLTQQIIAINFVLMTLVKSRKMKTTNSISVFSLIFVAHLSSRKIENFCNFPHDKLSKKVEKKMNFAFETIQFVYTKTFSRKTKRSGVVRCFLFLLPSSS